MKDIEDTIVDFFKECGDCSAFSEDFLLLDAEQFWFFSTENGKRFLSFFKDILEKMKEAETYITIYQKEKKYYIHNFSSFSVLFTYEPKEKLFEVIKIVDELDPEIKQIINKIS